MGKKKKEKSYVYLKYVPSVISVVDYADMTKPFETLPEPKTPLERTKYVERFDKEFGEDYILNDFIDPADELTPKGEVKYPTHEALQLERIHRVKDMFESYKKAKKYHDPDTRKAIRSKALKPIKTNEPLDFQNFNYAKYNEKLKKMFE